MLKQSLLTPGHYKSLDGLRAFAILLVLLTHISQHIPGLSWVHFHMEWMTPLYNGWIGVDLFFVLSGFLVGSMVLSQLERGAFSVVSFFLARFFRIIPAYFAVIISIVLMRMYLPGSLQSILPAFHLSDVVQNALLLTDYLPGYLGIQSWSLSIEEQFYLIVPFFLLFFRRVDTRIYAAISLIFFALLFRAITYRYFAISEAAPITEVLHKIYFPFHARMDALAVGILVALIHQQVPVVPKLFRVVMGALGLLLSGFVFLCGELKGGFYNTTIQYTLVCLGFGAVLWSVLDCALAERTRLATFLSAQCWVPVARLSYSVYLSHMIVIFFLAHFFVFKVWMFGFLLAFCFIAALPLYWCVEYPCHRFAKRRFVKKPVVDSMRLDTAAQPVNA